MLAIDGRDAILEKEAFVHHARADLGDKLAMYPMPAFVLAGGQVLPRRISRFAMGRVQFSTEGDVVAAKGAAKKIAAEHAEQSWQVWILAFLGPGGHGVRLDLAFSQDKGNGAEMPTGLGDPGFNFVRCQPPGWLAPHALYSIWQGHKLVLIDTKL